jgi:hypothetical protein
MRIRGFRAPPCSSQQRSLYFYELRDAAVMNKTTRHSFMQATEKEIRILIEVDSSPNNGHRKKTYTAASWRFSIQFFGCMDMACEKEL